MLNVERPNAQGDGGVGRHDHLFVGEDVVEVVGIGVGVGVAPEVLLAVDVDVERAAVRRQRWFRRTVGEGRILWGSEPVGVEFGGFLIWSSLRKVTTEIKTSNSAAPTVQPTSRRLLPWTRTATAPLLARNFQTVQISRPPTPKKTTQPNPKIHKYRERMPSAFGVPPPDWGAMKSAKDRRRRNQQRGD